MKLNNRDYIIISLNYYAADTAETEDYKMNRQCKHIFDGLRDADERYISATTTILDAFTGKVKRISDEAKAYKDEKQYVAMHSEIARRDAQDALNAEESRFRSAVRDARASLESELDKAISAPVPSAFTERLAFYRTAQITPGRTEAAAMLKLAGKSLLAVNALGKLLDDTSSPVRVDAPSVADFEADVETLRQMEEAPLHHAALDHHADMSEVLKGSPMPTRTADGWQNIGEMWDGLPLLMLAQGVRGKLDRLQERADVWSADVSSELRERESAAVAAAKKDIAEITGEDYNDEEPASTVTISDAADDAAIETARELGHQNIKPNVPPAYLR